MRAPVPGTAPEFGMPRLALEDPLQDLESPFRQVIRLMRRRSRLIITFGIIGLMLGGVVGLVIPPRYTATAELVAEPPVSALTGALLQNESAINSHMVALTSYGHLERVLQSLAHDPPLPVRPKPHAAQSGFTASARRTLSGWLAQAWDTVGSPVLAFVSPPRATTSAAERMNREVEQFKRHLQVFQEQGSNVLGIRFSSTNPEEAARAANRVAKIYADNLYAQKQENTARTLGWIGKRIPELKQEIDRAEAQAQAYRNEHNLTQGKETDTLDQRLADLNNRVTAAQAKLTDQQAKLDALRQFQRNGADREAALQSVDSPTLRAFRERELSLLQTKADLSATLGEMNPRTRAINAQIQAVRTGIANEVRRAEGDLEAQVEAAALQLQSLRSQLATVQASSAQSRNAASHLEDLGRGAATIRQVYESLLQRREKLIEQQEMTSPDVRVLSLASRPDRPSSANPLLFPLPTMIVFLIGGAMIAMVSERLDQGLRSGRDVHEALGIPCIGLIPEVRRTRSMRPHHRLLSAPFAPYAEAIRSLAASLQLASPGVGVQTVLISSSVPREGKTTLAVSLAVYAALIGRRVVLVDLDFRRPAVWRELANSRGSDVAAAYAADGLSLAAIEALPQLGLDVLPIGLPADPLLPFAGGELPRLLNQLRARYDCIVIDGPPLLSVTEPRLLATFADKILFVVKWGSTRRDMAQNALSLLRDARPSSGGETIAGVITQVDMNKHARYRYGDAGESFVRYARYYEQNTTASPRRLAARGGDFHRAPRDSGWDMR